MQIIMRNLITVISVSFLLMIGGVSGYAADSSRGHQRDRHEQRDSRGHSGHRNHGDKKGHDKGKRPNSGKGHDKGKRPGSGKGNHGHKDHHGNRGGHMTPGHSVPRPGSYGRPVPPPPHHRPAMAPPGHCYPDRLGRMVNHATRGCRNVSVWQVDNDTFVVRYLKGGRYYTRYIYPYANRYGAVQLLTPGWQPFSSWLTVPSIQVNLWL